MKYGWMVSGSMICFCASNAIWINNVAVAQDAAVAQSARVKIEGGETSDWGSTEPTDFTPTAHHPNIASIRPFAQNPDIVTPIVMASLTSDRSSTKDISSVLTCCLDQLATCTSARSGSSVGFAMLQPNERRGANQKSW
jgi:hypothetical protein